MAGRASSGRGRHCGSCRVVNLEIHLAFKRRDKNCKPLVDRYVERSSRIRSSRLVDQSRGPIEPFTDGWNVLCALDGRTLSTEQLAQQWRSQEELGTRIARVCVGGADGWPGEDAGFDLKLAFGRATMAHELAAVVAAEQLYRILTLIDGHPYHSGHA